MAKQAGIIRLKGSIGGMSFYKTSDGYLVREKGGIDGKRIANDPAFQRTRENGEEFGRAGAGSKLIRNAIRLLLQNVKDKRVASRLTTQLLKVIKTDAVNARGERTIPEGNMALLHQFEFNKRAELHSQLAVNHSIQLDRSTGEVILSLDTFQPLTYIDAPEGTTHFKLGMGATELNFEDKSSVFDMEQTPLISYDSTDTPATDLTATLTAGSTLPIVVVLGLEFYQEVNGTTYPLKNGSFNALAVVQVDQTP
ncbi:hypothetical protein [Mesonia sp. K7]|uniref:hypothetical protein n=1 Tax=Mesonia sp. K7 TaxID=2218606 RepID=UPI000DA8CA77|nr:hypothetical protein [Mesonia sp. K7]PZD79168.1 hypothetical protein DNG35_03945 [Mesonia sp. K7]